MFLICLLLWILFNGRITVEILLFGLAVSAAVYAVSCALFGFSFQKDLALLKKLPGMVKLFGILLAEIAKANLAVTKIIYSRNTPKPRFVAFNAPLAGTAARVALADCITLTPGTITGLLEDGRYTVHCLDESMADGLDDSTFVRQLQKIEQEGGELHK